MYGSLDGVKANLPKLRKYIKNSTDSDFKADLDISEATVTDTLEKVTDQIDAALSPIYVVPFQTAPDLINQIADDLAAFRIARSYMVTIDAETNQQLLSMRKDAKEILTSLSNGAYTIPGAKKKDAGSLEDQLSRYKDDQEEIFDMEEPFTWQDKI